MGARYENTLKEKMLAITADTLAAGADIAKFWRRARFVDFSGLERGNALKFNNRKAVFDEPSGKDKGDMQAAQKHLLFCGKNKKSIGQ